MAAVLAKVQKEVGADAHIASAQKVRAGGVGGFFAREMFEVLVEIPSPGDVPTPKPLNNAAKSPASLLDVVDQVNVVERVVDSTVKPPPTLGASVNALPTAPKAPTTRPISSTPIGAIGSSDTDSAAMQTPQDRVSTESDDFAAVLSRIANQANLTTETAPAPAPAPPSYTRPIDEVRPPVAAPAPVIASVPVIEGRPAFLDTPGVVPVAAQAPTTAAPAPIIVPSTPIVLPDERTTDLLVASERNQSAAALVPTESTSTLVPAVEEPAVRTRATDSPLAKLGLPAEFIPQIVDVDTENKALQIEQLLTTALEDLPKTPDIKPSKGSIIAVVGGREDATILAEELAVEWGRPTDEVVLASQTHRAKAGTKVVRNIQNAEDSARSWSRRTRPTIVVVEAHMGSKSTAWAEHILTALEPIATYGTVDATSKAEDISAWAEQLGGVDCLAVNYVEETVSPAAVLAAGIPVERIDGRKATPAYWAMLLSERLQLA